MLITRHTHTFNGSLSGITRVSRYQKDKTSLDLTEARDDGVFGRSGISWTVWSDVQTCIGPADATATHCLLLQQNPDWFYLFGSGSLG